MFGIIPNINKLKEKGNVKKLVKFLKTDKGDKRNSEKRAIALDEATKALFEICDESSKSILSKAVNTPNPYAKCRLSLALMNIGDTTIIEKAYLPLLSPATNDNIYKTIFESLTPEVFQKLISSLGNILTTSYSEDTRKKVAEHLLKIYHLDRNQDIVSKIRTYNGALIAESRDHDDVHTDFHTDKEEGSSDSGASWCEHTDEHTDYHSDYPAKAATYFNVE